MGPGEGALVEECEHTLVATRPAQCRPVGLARPRLQRKTDYRTLRVGDSDVSRNRQVLTFKYLPDQGQEKSSCFVHTEELEPFRWNAPPLLYRASPPRATKE